MFGGEERPRLLATPTTDETYLMCSVLELKGDHGFLKFLAVIPLECRYCHSSEETRSPCSNFGRNLMLHVVMVGPYVNIALLRTI